VRSEAADAAKYIISRGVRNEAADAAKYIISRRGAELNAKHAKKKRLYFAASAASLRTLRETLNLQLSTSKPYEQTTTLPQFHRLDIRRRITNRWPLLGW